MRILLAIHNAYSDHTSGAAHSARTIVRWLAGAGHECQVLATARFDAKAPDDLDAHLSSLGVPLTRKPVPPEFLRSLPRGRNTPAGCPTVEFALDGVPVTMLLTRHNRSDQPDRVESETYLLHLDRVLSRLAPDVLLTYGPHPVVAEAMRRARLRRIITVFRVANVGYEDRRWFQHADAVLTVSEFLAEYYRRAIGLVSTAIQSPIEWADVLAPPGARTSLTFVNPSLPKGVVVFARIAEVLGAGRPDIPILVVQSAAGTNPLAGIMAKHPRMRAIPPVPRPADFLGLTKLLLVPSVGLESSGRVAAEALINGIPPLVSDRGGLPETVRGAGRVLPIPAWVTETNVKLPSAEEVAPWLEAICELWDRPRRYEEASLAARMTAERLYSERVVRARYARYFESLRDLERRPP